MSLPHWCQTHSLKDFLILMNDFELGNLPKTNKRKETMTNAYPDTPATEAAPVAISDVAEAAVLTQQVFNEATGEFETVTVTTEEAGVTTDEGIVASPADVNVTIH